MGMRKPSMGLDFTYYWCITWSVLAQCKFLQWRFWDSLDVYGMVYHKDFRFGKHIHHK